MRLLSAKVRNSVGLLLALALVGAFAVRTACVWNTSIAEEEQAMRSLVEKGYRVWRTSERRVGVLINGNSEKKPVRAVPPRWYQQRFYPGFMNCVYVMNGASLTSVPYDRRASSNEFVGVYDGRSDAPPAFKEIGKLPSVASVFLQNVSFSIDDLQQLRHCQQLRRLSLLGSQISGRKDAVSFPRITSLENVAILATSPLPNGLAESILESCPSLRGLELSGGTSDVTVGEFTLASESKLTSLTIKRLTLGNGFFKNLPRTIEWMVLQGCVFEDERIAASALSRFQQLRYLDMSHTSIGDTFCESLESPSLKSILLEGTRITSASVASLEQLPLEYLHVGNTPLADEETVTWRGREIEIKNGRLLDNVPKDGSS